MGLLHESHRLVSSLFVSLNNKIKVTEIENQCLSISPGEEEETEHVGGDEHVEDQVPLSAARKGSRQQWTNRCSDAEMVINVKGFTPQNMLQRFLYRKGTRRTDLPVPSMIAVTVASALLDPLIYFDTLLIQSFTK